MDLQVSKCILSFHTWFGTETVDDTGSSTKIREREFVELGPALWNQHATLLHHGMEPRQSKQGLRPNHGMTLLHVVLGPGFICSLQVAFDPWWSLIRDLEAGLEEDGGESRVAFSRQPEAEHLVRLQTVQLFL